MKRQMVAAMLVWTLVVAVSLAWNVHREQQEHRQIARKSASAFFQQIVLDRAWNAGHGGVYVPVTESTPPNPYLEDSLRDLTTKEGILLTKINPAYMTRQIAEIAASKSGVQFHITSLNPIRPANKATDWETKWLRSFEDGVKEQGKFSEVDNDVSYRYMAPLLVKKSCLGCHEKQGYKLGDVRGGISITLPFIEPVQSTALFVTHAIALLLGVAGILVSGVLLGRGRRKLVESNNALAGTLAEARQLANDLQAEHVELEAAHQKLEGAHTNLKAAQSQMLQREKMASIGQLAAGVAHEINNPIGFITSNLGTLHKYVETFVRFIETQSQVLSSLNANDQVDQVRKDLDIEFLIDDTADLLQESIGGAKRVKQIVQNLKGFSCIDEVAIVQADINECIQTTLKLISTEIESRATVDKVLHDLPITYCSPRDLNQALMNILINALKAIEEHGRIDIRTWHKEGVIHVTVSDNGNGISPDALSRIFDPFYTTREVGDGTGLGLSVCHDIIKRHGGEISAASELGKGTTIHISVPVLTSADDLSGNRQSSPVSAGARV